MKKTNDFGRDSIPLLVLKISVPFMFAQFVNVLYSIVDRIYVGNIPVTGADALAGVGVCAPVVTLLSSFGTLFGIGGSVLFSVRLGAEDKRNARKILANSFSYLIIVSLALTLIFLVTKDQLLNWFGASDVTFPYADAYMTIYTAGTFFALLGTGMNYFITAQGFPLLGMTTTLIGAVINIVLDPVFIFLFDMGVAGAAVATVLAQMCSCAFVLCTLRRKKMPVPLGIVRPDRDTGKRIVKIGFSPFLILASDSIIIIALNAVLQYYGGPEYGDTLITAATIVQSYMLLITSPMLGITFFWVLMLCVCFTAFMFLISRIMPWYFVRIFTDEPAYAELAVWGIRVFTLMIVPLSFQYVIVDGLTALGMTKISLSLSLTRKSLYFAATCLIPFIWAARDAFYAEPFADGVSACISCVIFFFIYRKYLRGEGRLGEIRL